MFWRKINEHLRKQLLATFLLDKIHEHLSVTMTKQLLASKQSRVFEYLVRYCSSVLSLVIIEMPLHYSRDELVDMLLVFGRADENPYEAARMYAQKYPDRRHPQHGNFSRLIQRVRETGTVDYKKPNFENPPVCHEDIENEVMLQVVEKPHTSTREIANEIGVSQSSVSRIIRKNKFHPYKMIVHQELSDNDFILRQNFSQWSLQKIAQNGNFFENVVFTDEATFRNDSIVIRHNMHYYDNVNPHWTRERRSQHRWSLNVWCGIVSGYIIGPIFIRHRLTGNVYLHLLENEIQQQLNDLPENLRRNLWWQHDGAPPHFAANVREFLNDSYGNRWIGRGGPTAWPPRSPDLTPPDFFLWGYIKSKVYIEEPTTAQDMEERIRTCIRLIPADMVLRSVRSLERRFAVCMEREGRPFEHFL